MHTLPRPRCHRARALISALVLLAAPSLSPAAILPGSSYWSFEEGISATDGTPSTTIGNITTSAASAFNGTSGLRANDFGYLETGVTGPSGSSARSLSLWFRTNGGTDSLDTLIGWGADATSQRYDFRLDGSNLRIEIDGTGHTFSLDSPVNDGQWHHATLTFRGGSFAYHRLYVDGGYVGRASSRTSVNTGTSNIRIGSGIQRDAGSARDFSGDIDDVAVFTTELDEADAALLCGLGRIGLGPAQLAEAKQTWEAAPGTRTLLDGHPWTRTNGLSGTAGSIGGPSNAPGRYVVVSAQGEGIIHLDTPRADQADLELLPTDDRHFEIGFGDSAELPLEVNNLSSEGTASWQLIYGVTPETAAPGDPLENLAEAETEVLATLPDRYLFSEGVTGNNISDGGGDMYDGGNRISIDDTLLSYSDNTLTTVNASGGEITYFTRKLDGLFIFSAELDGRAANFSITGNLGADGAGNVTAEEFTIAGAGRLWRAYVKRVHDAGDPSINHLILVPDHPGISRTHLTGTGDENHRITGLEAADQLHYLLFSLPNGGFAPTPTFEALGSAFLQTLSGGPSWLTVSPDQSDLSPGESINLTGSIDTTGLLPGRYETLVAAVLDDTDPASLPAAAWRRISIEVAEPTFALDTDHLDLVSSAGLPPTPAVVTLTPARPGLDFQSDVPWLSARVDPSDDSRILVEAEPSGLDPGFYTGRLTVVDGATLRHVRVELQVAEPQLTILLPDPTRPRLYALHKPGKEAGLLLVYDTSTREPVAQVPLGREPTDFDLTEDASELLVVNTSDRSIMRVDLESLTVTDTYLLSETDFSNRNDDFGGHVEDGPGSVIYYVDEQWGPRLRVYDTATRQVLQTFSSVGGTTPDTSNNYGYGGIVVSPDGSRLFGWRQYGDGAGVGGTHIVRFDVGADGLLSGFSRSTDLNGSNFTREPFDTPLLFTGDGGRLIIKDREIDQENLDQYPFIYADEIYSIVPGGEIVFTADAAYRSTGGTSIHNLGGRSPVQAVLPDYSALAYFSDDSGQVEWLDLIDTFGPEQLGLELFPPDGGTVADPSELRWFPQTGIRSYAVFLGNDRAEVEAAGMDAPEFLGQTSLTRFTITSPLLRGTEYFWKVVPLVGGELSGNGLTRSFTVSPLTLTNTPVEAELLEGFARHRETIAIDSPTPATWSASSDSAWIRFESTTGSAPGELQVILDASSLAPGFHQGEITLTSDGTDIRIPVGTWVREASFVHAVTDWERPLIYAISQLSTDGIDPAFLVEIDSRSGEMLRSRRVGAGVTDLEIHYRENRIYVPNWRSGVLIALDRDTLEEEQAYQFPPFGEIGYSDGDIFRVSAGQAGRIIYEPEDQWVDIGIYDTESANILATAFVREGGGSYGPLGRYYYHGENNSSGADLIKFDTEGDTFTSLASRRVTQYSYYGSRTVVVSIDGSRIFWNGGVFDSDLNVLQLLDDEVIACSIDGSIVFTEDSIYNSVNGANLATLPVATKIQALSNDQQALFLFDGDGYQILDLAPIVELPGGGLVPGIPNGATVAGLEHTLSWSAEAFAISYDIYFGTDRRAIASADANSPEHLGSVGSNVWDGAMPELALGTDYFWRVDIRGANGMQAGEVWEFRIAPIDVSPTEIQISHPFGAPVPPRSLLLSAGSSLSWTASTTTPWLSLSATSGETDQTLQLQIDSNGLAVGTHEGSVTLRSGRDAWEVPVSIEIIPVNFTFAVADFERDRIYAISQESESSNQPAHLLVIDTGIDEVTHAIPVGSSVTDLAVHYFENRIYVPNWKTGLLRALDRDTFEEVQTYQFSPYGGVGRDSGDIYRVSAGVAGRLVIEQQDQWMDIKLIDTADGSILDTAYERQGGGAFHPLGRYYYHGDNNSTGSEITRYDTAGDELTPLESQRYTTYFSSRRTFLSPDGSRVFWNGEVYNPHLDLLFNIPQKLVQTTRHGELIFSADKIYNGANGLQLAELPVITEIQAVSSDQQKLYLFDGGSLATVDLRSIADLPGRETTPDIADGATVIGTNQRLGWSLQPFALSYDVYFGTDRDAVASAVPGDEAHLGNLSTNFWPSPGPDLALGGRYFWRVDVNGYSSSETGAVWSFDIAPIDASPRAIELSFPENTPIPDQSVTLSAPAALPWSATTTTPWITLDRTSGSTDDTLTFGLDSTGLAEGPHHGTILLSSGEDTWELPVSLNLIRLDVTRFVADPARPGIVYGLNYADPDTHFSHVLRIHAETGRVIDSIEAGRGATDLEIDPSTDRLYIATPGFPTTPVIDLAGFTALAPLELASGIHRIECDGRGRLFSFPESTGSAQVWNLDSPGETFLSFSVRTEAAVIDPDGTRLFVAPSNGIYGFQRFDISDTAAVPKLEINLAPPGFFTDSVFEISDQGDRLLRGDTIFDDGFRIESKLPGSGLCLSPDGQLVAGASALWWADGGSTIANLGFTADTAGFTSDGRHLVCFEESERRFRFLPTDSLVELPGPWPRPGQTLFGDANLLRWNPVDGASSYTLRIEGGPDGPLLYEDLRRSSFSMAQGLAAGRSYRWRVDANTPNGTVTGTWRSFSAAYPEGPPIAAPTGHNSKSVNVALGDDRLLFLHGNSVQLHLFDPQTGSSSPSARFNGLNTSSSSNFGFEMVLDDFGAFVADTGHGTDTLNTTGAFYPFEPTDHGYYRRGDPVLAPTPQAGIRFGGSMGLSGNQLLVGTYASSSEPGRVVAYQTFPELRQMQVIQAANPIAGDGFGNGVAVHGNTALIIASGEKTAHIFERDLTSGEWVEQQSFGMPSPSFYDSIGSSVALSDGVAAINNHGRDSVYLFIKENGSWRHAQTITSADVPDAGTSFGTSVALHGDTLFIGDPRATQLGTIGGAVFPYHRDGNTWTRGTTITPRGVDRSGFGGLLSAHEGWLLVGGDGPWLFRIEDGTNRSPSFVSPPPFQAVSGRAAEFEIQTTDPDGHDGLVVQALQLPDWLSLSDRGDGSALLSGTPTDPPGSAYDLQWEVVDENGASSIQTTRLTLLAPDDVPRITLHPSGATLGEGQAFTLRGHAEGTGPLTWQWYQDGQAIYGATAPDLIFNQVTPDDAGNYHFVVSNAVGSVESESVVLTIREPNRFAGDWTSFGSGSNRTGHHPATLGRHTFVPAWDVHVATENSRSLNRPAIADGRVFITPEVYFDEGSVAAALDLESGATLWTHPFESAYSINPPTFHEGRLYIQRGNHSSDTQLWCLDSETGAAIWNAPHRAQWERYESPAVTHHGIWVNGGSYGGMYGFTPDGEERFFHDMDQVSGWTPAVHRDRLFTSLGNQFTEHSPFDGTPLWSVTTGGSGTSIPVVNDHHAVVLKGTFLTRIDPVEKRFSWDMEIPGARGTPAIDGESIYVIANGSVVSLHTHGGGGADGPTYHTGEARLTSVQPLVLNDHLIVASEDHTYIFERDTAELIQTLDVGGLIAYSDGYLLIAGQDGQLHAFFANAAPEIDASFPSLLDVPDDAGDVIFPLALFADDPDPEDPVTWSISEVSRPDIFNTLEIDPQSGDLTVIYNPWQSGSSTVSIDLTDSAGNTSRTSITFTVPELPLPDPTLAGSLILNRQTGLYEHSITVTNPAAREIAGFDLAISSLPEGVEVHNASSCENGIWCVQHRQPLAAGASVTLLLEYYAPLRGTVIDPEVTVSLVTEPELDPAAAAPGLAVDRCELLDDGLLIEFTSTPGGLYEIQYSDDNAAWKISPTRIRAAGNRVQWIDRGPPRTDAAPADKASRFYRVREILENE